MTKIRTYTLLFLIIICSWSELKSQAWKTETDFHYFRQIYPGLTTQWEQQRQAAEIRARELNIPVRERLNGGLMEVQGLGATGHPFFYKTFNLDNARITNVDRLRPRNALALNLTGRGMTVGMWDGDNFDDQHIEFAGRVQVRGSLSDTPLGLGDNHSTHVGGTIAASGVNANARGMAPDAFMFAYDFNNDIAEIAFELSREEPLLVSNHSYGLVLGWQFTGSGWIWVGDPAISNVEDFRFGFYTAAQSRVLDEFAFNAPYYLHVRAAGNDRSDVGAGDRPPDGPYDIIGPSGVAKNVLTVGAVEKLSGRYSQRSDVVMSEFSSWGPTDDGRVKPDISAPGVNTFSAFAEGINQYGSLSGTSMAAPTVSGALILLQQLYAAVNGGEYMRSATLKGLVINSANPTGNSNGPDYEFGWGLLAADRAANTIVRNDGSRYLIRELTLQNNDSIVVNVTSDGISPLLATICWTDLPGTPPPPSLNPTTRMLVNDLDMRIRDENGNVFLPWILDPSRPNVAATTGDNNRDNVEKIEIANPVAGNYSIVIRHKGTLRNARQAFSLIVSAAPTDISLTTLFWRGGNNGDWNNPANWSLTPGGGPANIVPGPLNPVIFDTNAFTAGTPEVSFSANANCYSLQSFSSSAISFNMNGFNLNIDGNVQRNAGSMSFSNGNVIFTGNTSRNNFIDVNEQAFANIDLSFNSPGSSWSVVNNITTREINLINSSLIIRNKTVNLRRLQASQMTGRTIDFRGSTVSGLNNVNLPAGATTRFQGSTLNFSIFGGINQFTFNGGSNIFHNVQVSSGTLAINGNNTFNAIRVQSNLRLNGNNIIDSLGLSAGTSMLLNEGTTQTIIRSFIANSQENNRVSISSTGTGAAALFADDGNLRFCFDFLNITNVSASGQTSFLAGNNSNLSGITTGWVPIDCADALFPDFEVQFLCPNSEAQFVDRSNGTPLTWSWNFGDPQFPDENTSTTQNPSKTFRFQGQYNITFRVSDDTFEEQISRTITVPNVSTQLSVPTVNVDGTELTSSIVAPVYQWFINGDSLPGSNQRTIDFVGRGRYSVVVSDGNCRFRAREVVVTSIMAGDLAQKMQIFPNPGSGIFHLSMAEIPAEDLMIRILDISGREIMHRKLERGQSEHQFDLSGKPGGMYLVQVHSPGSVETLKLVLD